MAMSKKGENEKESCGVTMARKCLRRLQCCCFVVMDGDPEESKRASLALTAKGRRRMGRRNDGLGDVELASVATVNDGVHHSQRRGIWLKRYSVEYGRDYFEDTGTGHTVWQLPDNATVVDNSSENFSIDNPMLGSNNARNLPSSSSSSSSSSESDTE